MYESKILNEFARKRAEIARAEGRAEVERAHLRSVLRRRAPDGLPVDLDALIEKTTDPDQLQTWFEIALDVQSLDEFRHRLLQTPPNGNGQGTP